MKILQTIFNTVSQNPMFRAGLFIGALLVSFIKNLYNWLAGKKSINGPPD